MTEKHYTFQTTTEYDEWVDGETRKSRVQIADRLSNIENEGHFGIHKGLEDGVSELKWGGGRRVYYSIIPEKNMILLLGGNKNGQDKDIAKAKKILKRYV
jgi:putative addiction module killer protein